MVKPRLLATAVMVLVVAFGTVAPVGGAYDHGDDSSNEVKGPCSTNPAFNATSARGVPVDATGEDAVHVDIPDFRPFEPATLTVDRGTCVEWKNTGDVQHTVTIAAHTGGTIGEQVDKLGSGDQTHRTFHEPGVYYIHCEISAFHSATMHQVIYVQ